MLKSEKIPGIDQAPLLCEYAVMPFPDCFCLNITGYSIPKIAKYCMDESIDCPVYEKCRSEKERKQGKIDV